MAGGTDQRKRAFMGSFLGAHSMKSHGTGPCSCSCQVYLSCRGVILLFPSEAQSFGGAQL